MTDDYIVQLRTAFKPPYLSADKQIERYGQFLDGLQAFFRHAAPFRDNAARIYLIDNTIPSVDILPGKLRSLLQENGVEVVVFDKNAYGSVNKGAGEIQSIQHMRDVISKYKWFIHFEPRQVMQSAYFAESFFSNPRDLFTVNVNPPPHFNTGLYATRSEHILKFVEQFTDERLRGMVNRRESLEYLLYDFYKANFAFETLDKMDLFWFSPEGQRYHW